jgi:hypothetical protein
MSDGITVQVVGHETGKENNSTWTRITVVNSRGRFNAKYWGAKATNLTRDLLNTLQPGETIATKRLFIELNGDFETFTKEGSNFKVRYFKAEDYAIIDGPSLELARMRGEALSAVNNSETLRNAGALAQAYKSLAAYVAELAQLPLDLSEMRDIEALTGTLSEDDGEAFNPEAAAAAHYLREEALAEAIADEEDAAIDAAALDGDLDEIILSASDEPLPDDEANPENGDGGTTVYTMLNSLREPSSTDTDIEEVAETSEVAEVEQTPEDDASNDAGAEEEAEAEAESAAAPEPAPASRRFGRR